MSRVLTRRAFDYGSLPAAQARRLRQQTEKIAAKCRLRSRSYLEDSERRDYESHRARDRKGHIYEAVLIVHKWLETNMTPSDQDKRDAEKHRLRQAKKLEAS